MKKDFVIQLENLQKQNVFIIAETQEEAEALVAAGEGDASGVVESGWHPVTGFEDTRKHCAYCGKPAGDEWTMHRDGYGKGPEVPICDECTFDSKITNEMIWKKIGQDDTAGV